MTMTQEELRMKRWKKTLKRRKFLEGKKTHYLELIAQALNPKKQMKITQVKDPEFSIVLDQSKTEKRSWFYNFINIWKSLFQK